MRVTTANGFSKLFRQASRQQQWTRPLCLTSVIQQKSEYQNGNKGQSPLSLASAAIIGIGATAGILYWHNQKKLLAKEAIDDNDNQIIDNAGKYKQGLPEYRKSEVGVHDDETKRIWVTFKHGVYDITDFVSKHPGAKNILMAAGGSLEPFWNLYAVHKGNAQVMFCSVNLGSLHF